LLRRALTNSALAAGDLYEASFLIEPPQRGSGAAGRSRTQQP
jgi:hypothetical protein